MTVNILLPKDVFAQLPKWKEGFGITVIKAMAVGLSRIVNDHGALPEILQDAIQ